MIALAGACLALTAGSAADARRDTRHAPQSRTYGSSSDEYYTARSGNRVHRPIRAARAPAGASAQCRDGSWSFSENRRGTCSHHGGVARWL
ncbi:DUF3761 domain-containing protein [Sphingomonas sp. ERG5]|uniref:DUF3761 domain-containing protein n=1 Tax=Sphingomonas sp. ERG5 TaxID=1381597 RepID=UPI003FA747F3